MVLQDCNIGDSGLKTLAPAIAHNKSLVFLNLSQNALSPKSGESIGEIVSLNESLIELNLSSLQGSTKNRLGLEGSLALANALSRNASLI